MKILVVEDDPNNMMLLTIILKNYGHELIEAFTGAQGIEKTISSRPDLILMDIRLPDMQGFEATKKIREIMTTAPIIAVTSYALDEIREEYNKAGFDGLIQKPIEPKTIMNEIKEIMRDSVKSS